MVIFILLRGSRQHIDRDNNASSTLFIISSSTMKNIEQIKKLSIYSYHPVFSLSEKLLLKKLVLASNCWTTVARYHSGFGVYGAHKTKSWATKLVDNLFRAEVSTKFIKNLPEEVKVRCADYIANGWYYWKYDEKRNALHTAH